MENVQKKIICNEIDNCIFWGGYTWFLIFILVFSFCILNLLKLIHKHPIKKIKFINVIACFGVPLSLIGILISFKYYALGYEDRIVLSNGIKIGSSPVISFNQFTVNRSEIIEIVESWNPRLSRRSLSCSRTRFVYVDSGKYFDVDAYGKWSEPNLESYLTDEYNVSTRLVMDENYHFCIRR